MIVPCPFCGAEAARVFLRRPGVFALWDGFPVAVGHALIVPDRHVATWFDATTAERQAILGAIDAVCDVIRERYGAEGFNVGFNSGSAAGQTVPHLHLHVIPRRAGDVPDPRGGVRHVIPSKGNYLVRDESQRYDVDARFAPVVASPGSGYGAAPIDRETRLTTGGADPLLPHLEADLARASDVAIAVAFVLPSGIERLYPHFEDLLGRRGTLRLLTGDYLDITDPDALQRLLDLRALYDGERCTLRMFVSAGQSFHPKAYLVTQVGGVGVAYVGSSNLSGTALREGIEWNYRVQSSRDATGMAQIRDAFDTLFAHPNTCPLDAAWTAGYRQRRRAPSLAPQSPVDIHPEPVAAGPEPNVVQQEALAALAATRADGNRAGLVVMATGLGKTWLAAFDSNRSEFRRVLFVAHREEILNQAVATFRRIRPAENIGLYTGAERAPAADILFASIQTLSRRAHLERFNTTAFDYLVVDEFHHAAAATYSRLIAHFEPAFLLGLTATPERSDGGDLLGLCGENLVYHCGVPRGIDLELLCPYLYFGVPDEVDYENIPWRSTRFDEAALTEALATQRRSENVLDQWRKRAGERTLAFCVSQRHADFMRAFFARHGIACAAVHAGPTSDPRALSLERLAAGGLKVVFAVDMFNEGVDVPAIDTVMMLRPTESPVVWLQQFGRGLRKYAAKKLTVIDYIGNHRIFLVKARTLLAMQRTPDHVLSDRELQAALRRAEGHELDLPPGCEVTYELRALEILRALLRVPRDRDGALRAYYEDFKLRHGQRPTASEAFHDGYLPRSVRPTHGSWLGFVKAMDDFDDAHEAAWTAANVFLAALDITDMARSFKMLVLQAMLNTDTIPGEGIAIDVLVAEFARLARRVPRLQAEVGPGFEDAGALRRYLEKNPIAAWIGAGAVPGEIAFAYAGGQFRYLGQVPEAARDAFQQMVRELVDWRLAQYLARAGHDAADAAT